MTADQGDAPHPRIGLFGATGIGVGAIVGGGILALAGTAFAEAGPGAIVAFAGNSVIALLTAATFAALAARFPESGGTYTFARRVLSVEAAFVVGWIVWFASIVAGVLYAIGFGAFLCETIGGAWTSAPEWFTGRPGQVGAALLAVGVYTLLLERGLGAGGLLGNIIKVTLFALLIVVGVIWTMRLEPGAVTERMTPFLPSGFAGIATAMGFTFIAFQGFDLVAAASGEVRNATRTVPRAIFLSLGLAIAIYLPLLFVTALTLGDGEGVVAIATRDPEVVIALSAEHLMGRAGWWLVMVAGVFAMASALMANLFAASRIATAMAADRTLPARFEAQHVRWRTPIFSLRATGAIMAVLLLLLPDVSAAGAAASLIFLVTFSLAHGILYLARRRVGLVPGRFRTPFFPVVPVLGGTACGVLAIYQGVTVPAAGAITAGWVMIGAFLFIGQLANRARARDAASEARDPDLARLRGRSPLVLAPIANPANTGALMTVADALSPPGSGRVLLLSVIRRAGTGQEQREKNIADAQSVIARVFADAHEEGVRHETLLSIASDQWREIARVARGHGCAALVVGLSAIDKTLNDGPLLRLLDDIDCDAVILRTPDGWSTSQARKVLVPIAGQSVHDVLRARLVASLVRTGVTEVVYLRVIPADAPATREARAARVMRRIAADEAGTCGRVQIVRASDVAQVLADFADESDLLVVGLHQVSRKRRVFSALTLELAQRSNVAMAFLARSR